MQALNKAADLAGRNTQLLGNEDDGSDPQAVPQERGEGGNALASDILTAARTQKHAYQQRQTIVKAVQECFKWYYNQQHRHRQEEIALLGGGH